MSRLLNCASRFAAAASSLVRARDGGIAILFGLSLIPIIGLVGIAVDYGIAITNRTRLDRAADAAALAAVVTAKAYAAAHSGESGVLDAAIAAGTKQAIKTFNVNAGKVPLGTVTLQTPKVAPLDPPDSQTIVASVSYTATINNSFGKLFMVPTTTIANTATASVDLPSYLDFYLMVDVSGSMGLPTTADGMSKLAEKNHDMFGDYQQGCQFACHYPGNDGWGLAAGKIQLRSDAVNNAVCSLLDRASHPVVPNQYRIGIYPFINQLATLAALNVDVNALKTAAQCSSTWPLAFTNLLDTGTTQLYTNNDPTTGTGAGGTHFETVFPQMKGLVGLNGFGDGSTTTFRKPFVFLVTDGMQNSQHFYYVASNGKNTYSGNPSQFASYKNSDWSRGGSKPSQIDPRNCDALKAAGATISILYIPYKIIEFVDRGGNVIVPENKKVNAFSPTLATPLRECASSPEYFKIADSPDQIKAALNKMFDEALRVARLVQ